MNCHGHMRSFPPYVGGDDDDTITGWQAECCGCGWKGRETPYQSVAYGELVAHLNGRLLALEPAEPCPICTWPHAHRDSCPFSGPRGGLGIPWAEIKRILAEVHSV